MPATIARSARWRVGVEAAAMRALLGYRDLIAALVVRDLKVRYRRSAIGFVWTMLHPLLTMTVLVIVFSSVFRFALPGYPVYALAGILFWNFFNQSVVSSMNSLRGNAQLLQKVPVPKAVFPIATVIAGVVNLVLALVPLLAIIVVTGHPLRPALLFLPVAIAIATVFTLGAGLLLSPLAVFFSDVVEIVGVVLFLVMYLTPIFYPPSIVPAQYQWVLALNPLRHVLEVFRAPIYAGAVSAPAEVLLAAAIAGVMLAIGAVVFVRASDRIPFYL